MDLGLLEGRGAAQDGWWGPWREELQLWKMLLETEREKGRSTLASSFLLSPSFVSASYDVNVDMLNIVPEAT